MLCGAVISTTKLLVTRVPLVTQQQSPQAPLLPHLSNTLGMFRARNVGGQKGGVNRRGIKRRGKMAGVWLLGNMLHSHKMHHTCIVLHLSIVMDTAQTVVKEGQSVKVGKK